MRGALNGDRVVAGEEARLHLADPIGPLGILQTFVAGESTLGRRLVKSPMVKTSECPGQSTQGPYEAELRLDHYNDQAEPHIHCDFQMTLCDAVHLGEVVAYRQHVRLDMGPGAGRNHDIADARGLLDDAAEQITTGVDGPRPRHHRGSEDHIGSGLEALPFGSLDQLMADATEAVPRPVVAEPRAGNGSQPGVGITGRPTVATGDAEIHCATVDQDPEIVISGERG